MLRRRRFVYTFHSCQLRMWLGRGTRETRRSTVECVFTLCDGKMIFFGERKAEWVFIVFVTWNDLMDLRGRESLAWQLCNSGRTTVAGEVKINIKKKFITKFRKYFLNSKDSSQLFNNFNVLVTKLILTLCSLFSILTSSMPTESRSTHAFWAKQNNMSPFFTLSLVALSPYSIRL